MARPVETDQCTQERLIVIPQPVFRRQNTYVKQFLHKLLGDRGERAAARFLRRKGMKILAKQQRTRLGEIDLIALDQKQIVFIEVKTRRSNDAGQPFEAVDRRKQQKLTKLALAWLKERGRLNQSARFDVVSIIWPDEETKPQIDHYPNAFEPSGSGQFFS